MNDSKIKNSSENSLENIVTDHEDRLGMKEKAKVSGHDEKLPSSSSYTWLRPWL